MAKTVENTAESEPSLTAGRAVRTRDQIRQTILQTRAPKKKVVLFLGEDIEIRQPTLEDISNLKTDDSDENRSAIIDTLVKYAYVPNTDERVFEETDRDVLFKQPFGADFTRVIDAITELTDVNFPKPKGR